MYKLTLFLILLTQAAIAQQWHFKDLSFEGGRPRYGDDISFRGLSVVNDQVAWVSGTKGTVQRSTDGGKTWDYRTVKGYEQCDFRSIYAFDALHAVIANAGTPSYILRTTDGGKSWVEVLQSHDKAMFFDGMDFWNGRDGLIYSDPVHGHMMMFRTEDSGKVWYSMPEQFRPVLAQGEASFAASGTAIRCIGDSSVVIATGGKVSRLWLSDNRGDSWRFVWVPILQGDSTKGMFSIACKCKEDMIVVGGDYSNDTLKHDHVLYTTDKGKSWQAPTPATGGYRECVEYISKNTAIALGTDGADITTDDGRSWKPLPAAGRYHVVRKARNGKLVIAAGSGGHIAILER